MNHVRVTHLQMLGNQNLARAHPHTCTCCPVRCPTPVVALRCNALCGNCGDATYTYGVSCANQLFYLPDHAHDCCPLPAELSAAAWHHQILSYSCMRLTGTSVLLSKLMVHSQKGTVAELRASVDPDIISDSITHKHVVLSNCCSCEAAEEARPYRQGCSGGCVKP